MKSSHISTLLTELGLSENEAAVYLATLSLGATTILRIARAAELKRTTVYSVIESLKQKGLITLEVKGWKTLYVAENPEKLDTMIESRRAQLKKAMPELAALYNLHGGESFVKYYEGLEAIKSVYEGLIRDVEPHEDYLIVSNLAQWQSLDPVFFADFLKRRGKLPINVRMLFTDTPEAREAKRARKINETVKILPANTALTTNMVVTPQRVVIHQLTPPLFAIVIENRSTIHMQQEFFEIMWNALPN